MKFSSFVAGLICLGLCLPLFAQPSTSPVDKMSVEQKVGQLMVWSFSGTEFSPEIQQTLTKYQPGAFIVFRRNIRSPFAIAQLMGDAQKLASARKMPPLFMMVDQEGGLVTRVRTTTPMPSALALAKMDDTDFIQNYARATADVLSQIGFNVDLAPVLDISNPKLDSFIGNRTFGNDPEQVAELTLAYSQGIHDGGMLPTAKHFPGHGGTLTDSHHDLPRKLVTLEQLQQHDLVPFSEFTAAEFPKAVMTAHLSLPNVDPSGLPATYSPKIISEQLRQNLHYNGLVITDDLEMNGASIAKDIGERAVRAFLAGNDMLMFGGTLAHQRAAFEALVRAVKSGRVTRARLDESVTRILQAKSTLTVVGRPDTKRVIEAFKKLDQLSKQVMKRNFDVARQESNRRWPQAKTDTKVLVFSSNYRFFKNFEGAFKGKAKSYILTADTLDGVTAALETTRADYAVFFATGSQTAHWLNQLEPHLRGKVLVVNCNNAGEVDNQDAFMAVLNINSYFPEAAAWTAQLLNGGLPAVQQPPDVRTPAGQEDN